MTITSFWYGNALAKALNKEIDWNTDTVKCALLVDTYTPDQDTHDYFDDVVAHEVAAGGGYTAGGATLANCTVTYDAGTNTLKIDADDVTWAAATITAHYAVVYVDTGTDSTSPLIVCVDFGQNYSSGGLDFAIGWNVAGIAIAVVS